MLRATPNPTGCALIPGHTAPGDGGGSFWYDATATLTDNDGTCAKPIAIRANNPGRWKRLTGGDTVSAKWFGAKADGIADEPVPLITAATFASQGGFKLTLPSGTYRITKPLLLGSGQVMSGAGFATVIRGKYNGPLIWHTGQAKQRRYQLAFDTKVIGACLEIHLAQVQ